MAPRNEFVCSKCGTIFHVGEGDIIRCPHRIGTKTCGGGGKRLPEYDIDTTVKSAPEPAPVIDLTRETRANLEKRAKELGIAEPEAMNNRQEIIDAILSTVSPE